MSSSSRARWFIVVIAISASLISVRAEEEPGTQGVIAPLTSGPWYEHGYVGTSPNVTGYNNVSAFPKLIVKLPQLTLMPRSMMINVFYGIRLVEVAGAWR